MTNAAMPGFAIQVPANAAGAYPVYGTFSVAQLSAASRPSTCPQGVSGGMILFHFAGSALTQAGRTDPAEHAGITSQARCSTFTC